MAPQEQCGTACCGLRPDVAHVPQEKTFDVRHPLSTVPRLRQHLFQQNHFANIKYTTQLDLGVRKLLQGCADDADGHLRFQANNDDAERTPGVRADNTSLTLGREELVLAAAVAPGTESPVRTQRHSVLRDQKYRGARRM